MKQLFFENINSHDIKNLLNTYKAKNVFLVTGKHSYQKSGAEVFIDSVLNELNYSRFSEFDQNPKYEDVIRGTILYQKKDFDVIIAIGGGSVIDMAKLINIFSANKQVNGLDIVKNPALIVNEGKPVIAIPTTAGSGSEATSFAVVYYQKKKFSVAHPYVLPTVAGLKCELSFSQSKYLTACTGLDALSQAIESYWSVGANKESQGYSENAITLLIKNLKKCVNAPDKTSREAVAYGAYLAGKAINISKTTAPHAISYAFTTYFSIPHGHAVFLTLPKFLEFNYDIIDKDSNEPRGARYVRKCLDNLCKLLGVKTVSEGRVLLESLAREIDVELSLKYLEIKNYESVISNNVNYERLNNNPRKVSKDNLLGILKLL